jgi:tRNA (mo5U34)-methyltransferase
MNDLAEAVKRRGPWYHTFELPGGVVTDGYFDLREVTSKIPLPSSLAGRRCLDAAACEGYWSFELARRGAEEVLSLDLPETSEQDWQGLPADAERRRGTGTANEHFHFVKDALGVENVERVDMNLYDVNPDDLGRFDYVFVGNVLIHLADPARALRALRSVMHTDAELLSLDVNSFVLSALSPRLPVGQLWDWDLQPRWWTPNKAAHRQLVRAAGFEVLENGGPIFQPFGSAVSRWPKGFPRTFRELLYWLVVRRVGAASGWVRGRPKVVDGSRSPASEADG